MTTEQLKLLAEVVGYVPAHGPFTGHMWRDGHLILVGESAKSACDNDDRWEPHANIQQAFEVVDGIICKTDFCDFRLSRIKVADEHTLWQARFEIYTGTDGKSREAETPEEAVCLAALEAIEATNQ